jgi:hypothetical protein
LETLSGTLDVIFAVAATMAMGVAMYALWRDGLKGDDLETRRLRRDARSAVVALFASTAFVGLQAPLLTLFFESIAAWSVMAVLRGLAQRLELHPLQKIGRLAAWLTAVPMAVVLVVIAGAAGAPLSPASSAWIALAALAGLVGFVFYVKVLVAIGRVLRTRHGGGAQPYRFSPRVLTVAGVAALVLTLVGASAHWRRGAFGHPTSRSLALAHQPSPARSIPARNAEDPSTCQAMTSRAEADACYARTAQQLLDPKLCDAIGGPHERNNCFDRIAEQVAKVEICDPIDTPWLRTSCVTKIAVKRQSPSVCERLDVAGRDGCVGEVAKHLSDDELCTKIVTVGTRSACVSAIARSRKDANACERLVGQDRDECLAGTIWSSTRESDVAACERISSPSSRDQCITSVAAATNPLLCEKVGVAATDQSRLSCYQRINWHGTDCERVPNGVGADLCRKAFAVRAGNAQACSIVRDAKSRDACIREIAFRERKPALCLTITDLEERSGCAMSTYYEATDSRVCEPILTSGIKAQCLSRVKENAQRRQ